MRVLLALVLVALWLTAAPPLLADPETELERYGFQRDLDAERAPPPGPRLDPEDIPRPRRIPARDPRFRVPAPPPGAGSPVTLQPVPGARAIPKGVAPAAPPSQLDRATYVGDANCQQCHAEHFQDPERSHMALSRHSASVPATQRGCEGCHGPGSKHWGDPRFIVNPAKQTPEVASRTCLSCHRMQGLTDPHSWFFSRHASAKLSCTTCHSVHSSTDKALMKAPVDASCLACHKRVAREFELRSHHPVRREGQHPLRSLVRGKVSCIDCHDPHAGEDPHAMLKDDLERTCERCHAGHTGPWIFPHLPEHEGGSCLACHRPHGSPHRNLLKSRGRGSCLQCHTDRARDHFPGQGCATASCHVDVHGSNKSPLFFR